MTPSGMGSSVKVPAAVVATKSPPWFSIQLPTHTTDSEVRICADEPTSNEETPILLLVS